MQETAAAFWAESEKMKMGLVSSRGCVYLSYPVLAWTIASTLSKVSYAHMYRACTRKKEDERRKFVCYIKWSHVLIVFAVINCRQRNSPARNIRDMWNTRLWRYQQQIYTFLNLHYNSIAVTQWECKCLDAQSAVSWSSLLYPLRLPAISKS